MNSGRLKSGIVFFQEILSREPNRYDALCNMGGSYVELGNLGYGRKILEKAVRTVPSHPSGWYNTSIVHRQEGNFDNERTCLEIALEQNAPYQKGLLWSAMARNSQCYGEDAQAIEEYKKSLGFKDNSDIKMSIGMLQMKLGDFENGLTNYEHRLEKHPINWGSDTIPKWDKELGFYPNRRVLVCAEQGAGDLFQYARYGIVLKDLFNVDYLALFCPNDLAPIMRLWPGWDEIYSPSDGFLPEFDIQIAMMSIPLLIQQRGRGWGMITSPVMPEIKGYKRSDTRKNVGLCWRGNPGHPNDKFRSIHINCFRELIATTEHSIFAMQYAFNEFEKTFDMVYPTWEIDWMETARQIKMMDLLITCDTAVAHLAGSLGIPTWILLPLNSDFRWGVGAVTTYWYKSVRLFRQKTLGEWGPVIEEVMEELKKL